MEFTLSLTGSVIASGKGSFTRLCSGTGTNLCASNA